MNSAVCFGLHQLDFVSGFGSSDQRLLDVLNFQWFDFQFVDILKEARLASCLAQPWCWISLWWPRFYFLQRDTRRYFVSSLEYPLSTILLLWQLTWDYPSLQEFLFPIFWPVDLLSIFVIGWSSPLPSASLAAFEYIVICFLRRAGSLVSVPLLTSPAGWLACSSVVWCPEELPCCLCSQRWILEGRAILGRTRFL